MYVTAAEIARDNGIDPKRYRQALRDAKFSWYVWGAPWTVLEGSSQHIQLLKVMESLVGHKSFRSVTVLKSTVAVERSTSDESYVLDICDELLGSGSVRQHRFEFLRGDPGQNGKGAMLPVDAWYPNIALVVEYRERQHSEAVAFFDRRATVSGLSRGEQRKRYDQLRRDILPANGITLIEFDFFAFKYHANCRLVRCPEDRAIISDRLRPLLNLAT